MKVRRNFEIPLLGAIFISLFLAAAITVAILTPGSQNPDDLEITETSKNSEAPTDSETSHLTGTSDIPSTSSPSNPITPPPATTITRPLIDFQPMIDSWLKSAPGVTASISIYDLDNRTLVGTHNPDLTLSSASLYKIFASVAGYQLLESPTSPVTPTTTLISGRTWQKCLDLAVRESNIDCGEALLSYLRTGHLSASASDLTNLYQKIYYNTDGTSPLLTPAHRAALLDSMLNQPPSKGLCDGLCNWRQGLPSGFSSKATVYDKVGWSYSGKNQLWNLYHDAAIVEFPAENRHFIVILMTKDSTLAQIRRFAQSFESYFNTAIKNYPQTPVQKGLAPSTSTKQLPTLAPFSIHSHPQSFKEPHHA